MRIDEITKNKEAFMDLLLIGDENEAMINKYLDKSQLFVLYDKDTLTSLCAVSRINDTTIEIKNLSTYPEYQNKGYASILLDFICKKYKENFKTLILGTGENDKTLNFYKKRGFVETHKIKDFFIDNYSHAIFENGKQLIDMIYLEKNL